MICHSTRHIHSKYKVMADRSLAPETLPVRSCDHKLPCRPEAAQFVCQVAH